MAPKARTWTRLTMLYGGSAVVPKEIDEDTEERFDQLKAWFMYKSVDVQSLTWHHNMILCRTHWRTCTCIELSPLRKQALIAFTRSVDINVKTMWLSTRLTILRDSYCRSRLSLFHDSFKCTCKYCVDVGWICHFKLSKAHILSKVGTYEQLC